MIFKTILYCLSVLYGWNSHTTVQAKTEASLELHTYQLDGGITQNMTLLQNHDKNLRNYEIIEATDQMVFNQSVLQTLRNKKKRNTHSITQPYPNSCSDFNANYCENNKCRISNQIYGPEPFLVSCDKHTDGGGWTVIQRRINGSVDFYRNWSDYKKGFGNIDGEFFIGLEKLHALTTALNPMELMIQLQDFDDILTYAKYDEFIVGNEKENYKLIKVGKFSGNTRDSLSYHQGFNFTTKDRDNDRQDGNCAELYEAAWWYVDCFQSNLNGKYYGKDKAATNYGICWLSSKHFCYIKFVQMMIRPRKI